MNQPIQSSQESDSTSVGSTAVVGWLQSAQDAMAIVESPQSIQHLGISGVIVPEGVDSSAFSHQGLNLHELPDFEGGYHLARWTQAPAPSSESVWQAITEPQVATFGADVTQEQGVARRQATVATLLQLSTRAVPILPINSNIVLSTSLRAERELLRSMVFWRNRNGVSRHVSNLVHAGEDGLLIFTVDSWLIALNQNPEEVSIDVGSRGNFWLMLGTERDVHLHGSLLILPEYSGAILANELAR